MSPEDLKKIEEASERGIKNALTQLGFDTESPLESQKDMAFIRQQRQGSEQVSRIVRRTFIAAAIMGAISAVMVGIKDALKVSS